MRAFTGTSLALAIVCLTLTAIGWHFSSRILGPDHASTLLEQRILAVSAGTIRLTRDPESLRAGTWALQWEDGYGWVRGVIAEDSAGVVRDFQPIVGVAPVGGWSSLRGVSRSADPRSMLGLDFATVVIPGPLGAYPAWFVPGRDSTWVIYVHGRGANRSEGLRTLGVLASCGLPGLLITYRNDAGAPSSRDGYDHLGLTEWADLDAAVRFALAHGAKDVMICGYSMGGQIALQYLAHAVAPRQVLGVVLESPVLDWNATIMQRARALHTPAVAIWLGERLATVRAGLDWNALDRVAHTAGVTTPILLFHCVHDPLAPIARSEAFARALPRLVTLVRVEGDGHVDAWNADPVRYADTLVRWLAERRAPGPHREPAPRHAQGAVQRNVGPWLTQGSQPNRGWSGLPEEART